MSTNTTNTIIGIILCQGCVWGLALGSNTQRLGLESKNKGIRRVCFLPPDAVWLIGLIMYFAGAMLYMVSLWYAPASLMAALFAAMLPVNTLVARLINKEPLTRFKVAGSLVVLVGIALCGYWGPYVSKQYRVDDMAMLIATVAGALYLAALFISACILVLITWMRILRIEKQRRAQGLPREQWLMTKRGCFSIPITLAMFESTATLCMKGGGSILAFTLSGSWDQLHHWIFYAIGFVWIGAIIGQFWWLRQMLMRFEPSLVIPIEYGTVTIIAIVGGLIFYQEMEYVTNFGLLMMIVGMVIIVLGMGVTVYPELKSWNEGGHAIPPASDKEKLSSSPQRKQLEVEFVDQKRLSAIECI